MAFQFTNSKGETYYLNSKEISLRGSGKQQVIYYFSKNPREGAIEALPTGFEVIESQKTGLPVLRRVK